MATHVVFAAWPVLLLLCSPIGFADPVERGTRTGSPARPVQVAASAYDVETRGVYQPREKPGYACWVNVWRGASDELMMSFIEKRRAPNPSYRPIPLEFWESMALPIKYQASFCNGSRDILTECVTMRSTDEGKTWVETARFDTAGLMNLFAAASSGDGAILRVTESSYMAFSREDKPVMRVQKSKDGGRTWEVMASLLEDDYQGTAYRLKRLHDGMLVALCPFAAGFGPGRPRQERHTVRPNVIAEWQVGCWISRDEGKTWAGPLIVLPGILADEPDFVELPSGDLLILNSSEQGGPQVRQYVRRTRTGLIPGPVHRVAGGTVPETVCITRSGLLVGAIRIGAYTCSNDDGATWHEISGLPKSNYQPQIIELKDGRFLCAWHKSEAGPGGDHFVGQDHQFVGEHIFRLDASGLPARTDLELSRDMNDGRTRYTNAYTARLQSGTRPLPGRTVKFRVQKSYPEGAKPQELSRKTAADGTARLAISEIYQDIDGEVDIFTGRYTVQASFEPSGGDNVSPARSPSLVVYPLTAEKARAHAYPLFTFEHRLYVTPETLKNFPEIAEFVRRLRDRKRFTAGDVKQTLKLSDSRAGELIGFLVSSHLLRVVPGSRFEWRTTLSAGSSVQLLTVEDDFN